MSGSGVIETKLRYLEQIIHEATYVIVEDDCSRAAQHSAIHEAGKVKLTYDAF